MLEFMWEKFCLLLAILPLGNNSYSQCTLYSISSLSCFLLIVSGHHIYMNNFGEVFKEQIHIVNRKAKE